jgi:hypothetical protein
MTDQQVGMAITAFYTIVAGLVGVLVQRWRDWARRPQLRIDYRDAPANLVEVERKGPDGKLQASDIFVRVRVRNTGCRTAKSVVVYLTSLKKAARSHTSPTTFHDAKAMAWAGGKFAPLDLPPAPNLNFYVDVVRISKITHGWNFCLDQIFSSQSEMMKYSGTLRFHLTATADNADSASCEVDVTYTQNCNSLVVAPVRKGIFGR